MNKPEFYPRWAVQSELDPLTNAPNKSRPSLEFQNSGLKRNQPFYRDHLNYQFDLLGKWVEFFDNNLSTIQQDTTLYVSLTGDDITGTGDILNPYRTPHKALDSLQGVPIADKVTVTISCSSGIHTFQEPIVITHPYGDQIHLVGDPLAGIKPSGVGEVDWSINKEDPLISPRNTNELYSSSVGLSTTTTVGGRFNAISNDLPNNKSLSEERFNTIFKFQDCDGIICGKGGSLGLLNQVHIQGNWDGLEGTVGTHTGISTSYEDLPAVNVKVGKDVSVLGFTGNGVTSDSDLILEDGVVIANNGLDGILLNKGTLIVPDSITVLGNGNRGISIQPSGTVVAGEIQSLGNVVGGIYNLSSLKCDTLQLLGNGGDSYSANTGKLIADDVDIRGSGSKATYLINSSSMVFKGQISDNQDTGIACDMSTCTGADAVVTNNGTGVSALNASNVKLVDTEISGSVGTDVYADRRSYVNLDNPALITGATITSEKLSYISTPEISGVLFTPLYGTVEVDGATINE